MKWVKSTYSNSFSNCLEWQCAEAAVRGGAVLVRDSRLGDASPVLSFSPGAWREFTAGIKACPGQAQA